jgi:hypothetical protein
MSILELKDRKKDQRCFIFASGHSVNDFDFENIMSDDVLIGVNYQLLDLKFDYLIHSDRDVALWYDVIKPASIVVSMLGNRAGCTSYDFWKDEIMLGKHTPFYALQLAIILGCDPIYLVGFDYYSDFEEKHYYERWGKWATHADRDIVWKHDKFKTFLTEVVQKDYYEIQDFCYKDKIYYDEVTEYKKSAVSDFDKLHTDKHIYNTNKYSRLSKYDYAIDFCIKT